MSAQYAEAFGIVPRGSAMPFIQHRQANESTGIPAERTARCGMALGRASVRRQMMRQVHA